MSSTESLSLSRTAVEVAERVRRGEWRASDVVEDCIAAIEARNGDLNAFVYTDFDHARQRAAEIDAAVEHGEDPGPFAGVPFGVKDLEDCAGMPTSKGSLLYKDAGPVSRDTLHVARLKAAGAVAIGKTAAPEFGTLAHTRTRAWGITRNPWDLSRTPGGSSGGSAAAVAAGLLPLATASDGGGSTRIPASFSGLVGLKPSFGRIPSAQQDDSLTVAYGALVTNVRDAARHLDVAAGPDLRDKTSLPKTFDVYEDLISSLDVSGLRAAWTPDMGYAAVDPEVEAITSAAGDALMDAARLERRDVGVAFSDAYRAWLSSGALTLWLAIDRHAHWPARADDLTPYVRRALEGTAKRPIPTLDNAFRRRWQLESEVAALFEQIDVLLAPTTAVAAFSAAGPTEEEARRRKVPRGAEVPFTMLANLCWNPACSVPAGVTSEGLPIGLQIIARPHREDVVLRLARIFEEVRPWSRHAPLVAES